MRERPAIVPTWRLGAPYSRTPRQDPLRLILLAKLQPDEEPVSEQSFIMLSWQRFPLHIRQRVKVKSPTP